MGRLHNHIMGRLLLSGPASERESPSSSSPRSGRWPRHHHPRPSHSLITRARPRPRRNHTFLPSTPVSGDGHDPPPPTSAWLRLPPIPRVRRSPRHLASRGAPPSPPRLCGRRRRLLGVGPRPRPRASRW